MGSTIAKLCSPKEVDGPETSTASDDANRTKKKKKVTFTDTQRRGSAPLKDEFLGVYYEAFGKD
jgi:hypothetical protein